MFVCVCVCVRDIYSDQSINKKNENTLYSKVHLDGDEILFNRD